MVDHPDIAGEYLTPTELDAYLIDKAAKAALEKKLEEEKKAAYIKASTLLTTHEASDATERDAQIAVSLDPCVAHPACGARGSPDASGGVSDSNPWREDVEDRGLGPEEVHPGAYRVVTKSGKRATQLKELGNARYKSSDFYEGIRYYGRALAYCPVDATHEHARAVFHSNRGACYMALGKHRLVVEECTRAIELDPRYVRALMRRAKAYEVLDRLEDAVEDLNAAVDIDKSYIPALQEQRRIKKLYEEKTEKMKEEMLGKLKGFGNTILGKFGMSLDNFKLTPQDGGGYSVAYENS